MPYIEPNLRTAIDEVIDDLMEADCNEGQLNYIISRICHKYVLQFPPSIRNYSVLNRVVGVLECSKQEFIRTVLSPYEITKMNENGSISELDT